MEEGAEEAEERRIEQRRKMRADIAARHVGGEQAAAPATPAAPAEAEEGAHHGAEDGSSGAEPPLLNTAPAEAEPPLSALTPSDVSKLTVPKLKAALEERSLDTNGLKAALVERLLASLSSERSA